MHGCSLHVCICPLALLWEGLQYYAVLRMYPSLRSVLLKLDTAGRAFFGQIDSSSARLEEVRLARVLSLGLSGITVRTVPELSSRAVVQSCRL